MKFLDLDEKKKFLFLNLIFFIVGLASLFFINFKNLNKLNREYLTQNIAIIGVMAEGDNLENIIPIMTKGVQGNFEKGLEILEKYSYNLELEIWRNPLFKALRVDSYFKFFIGYLIIFLIGFFIFFKRFLNIKKEIELLTKKAEYIVEGRAVENYEREYKNKSFEMLNIQFDLMKNRIDKNIEDLKGEKLNLKNIINDVCHQYKTPLAAMNMYNDILKKYKKMKNEDIDYFMEMMNQQLERMDWLTKTLLKYARIEGGVIEYKKEYQSLNITLENTIKTIRPLAREKEIEIIYDFNEEVKLNHDRGWLEEAFINIIKNAIEHTEKGGEVSITIIESEILVQVEIEDNGEGINPKDINKIFKRFHKGSNSINPQSIGIGLSLSKNIIEANEGEIKVKSKVNKGSNFILTFIK